MNIVQTSQSAIVGLLAVKIFGGWGAFVGVLLNVAVLFALAEALANGQPDASGDWWLVSFGAGFSAHACRFGVA